MQPVKLLDSDRIKGFLIQMKVEDIFNFFPKEIPINAIYGAGATKEGKVGLTLRWSHSAGQYVFGYGAFKNSRVTKIVNYHKKMNKELVAIALGDTPEEAVKNFFPVWEKLQVKISG